MLTVRLMGVWVASVSDRIKRVGPTGIPAQVAQVVVGVIVIRVATLHSIRSRANECFEYEGVNASAFAVQAYR